MTVIAFPSQQGQRDAMDDGELATCPQCGGTWFELYVVVDGERRAGQVVMNAAGSVRGYSGIPHCVDCGMQQLP